MKTVLDNTNELIIKKSKFITYTYNINNKEDVETKLKELKEKYSDATHICYAYIINSQEKCFDDKEPQGTAGLPILNVLKKEKLQNVLCVIIRYFGGIKLGAGGLVRAYAAACKQSIITKDLIEGYEIKISFKYDDVKNIDYLLKNANIINKEYSIKTIYTFNISIEEYNNIKNSLESISEVAYIKNTFI